MADADRSHAGINTQNLRVLNLLGKGIWDRTGHVACPRPSAILNRLLPVTWSGILRAIDAFFEKPAPETNAPSLNLGNTRLLSLLSTEENLAAYMIIDKAFGDNGIGELPHDAIAALLGSQEVIEKLKTLQKAGIEIRFEKPHENRQPLGENEPRVVIVNDDTGQPAPSEIILGRALEKSGGQIVSELCRRIDGISEVGLLRKGPYQS